MSSVVMRVATSSEGPLRPIPIKSQVELLNPAHNKRIQEWLGNRAADLRIVDGVATYYVLGPQGGRIDIECEPVTETDLNGPLRGEWKQLLDAVQGIAPALPGDADLAAALQQAAAHLTAGGNGPNYPGTCLLKYRDPQRKWRLVWCWGYQRDERRPLLPTICRKCKLLRLQDGQQPNRCPQCAHEPPPAGNKGIGWKSTVLATLLVAAVGGGLAWWLTHESAQDPPGPDTPPPVTETTLRVQPAGAVNVPIGASQLFRVEVLEPDGTVRDVSDTVVVEIEDVRFARAEGSPTRVKAVRDGSSQVTFRWEELETTVNFRASARVPQHIWLDAASVTLGVGTTQRVRLLGSDQPPEEATAAGAVVDLSDLAAWSTSDPAVYVYYGLLEGMAPAREVTVAAAYPGGMSGAANPPAGGSADGASAVSSAPSSSYSLTAEVIEERYDSLRLIAASETLAAGESVAIRAEVSAADGVVRELTGSSQVQWRVEPNTRGHVAAGSFHAAESVVDGPVRVRAAFRELQAELELTITAGAASEPEPLRVQPDSLVMVPGELAELTVHPADAEVTLRSEQPDVVRVRDDGRLRAVATGDAKVFVHHPSTGQEELVQVTVEPATFGQVTLRPAPLEVHVQQELVVGVEAVTEGETPRTVQLAPEDVRWSQLPAGEYARFDPASGRLVGVQPTGEAEQALAGHWGEWELSAAVRVLPAPLRVELAPSGTAPIALGESLTLQAWAVGGDGTRRELAADQLQWSSRQVEPSESAPGVEFAAPRASAVAPSGKGLVVTASYQGQPSNEVTLVPAAASDDADRELALSLDRPVLLPQDEGRLQVHVRSRSGPVEIDPADVRFTTSDAERLAVDETSGAYRAAAPGEVTVTAEHPPTATRGELTLTIRDPQQLKLIFRPSTVKVPVDGQQRVALLLIADQEEVALLDSLGTQQSEELSFFIEQPDKVRWNPPLLAGVAAASPFRMTASYRGLTAQLQAEVVAGLDPREAGTDPDAAPGDSPQLQVVPATVRLEPRQPLKPRVQQRIDGEWVDVQPDKVQWSVPEAVIWVPAQPDAPPVVAVEAGTTEPLELVANYQGHRAALTITPGTAPPLTADNPDASLQVLRDPPGERLPAGRSQRYQLVLVAGERQALIPPGEVRWPERFENQFVDWNPPVLTAREPGHLQHLRAEVGDRSLVVATRTVAGPETDATAPESRPDTDDSAPPDAVVLQAPAPWLVPVGADLAGYRVLARYGEQQREVTGRAELEVLGGAASVQIAAGRPRAVAAGPASLRATYLGVASEGVDLEVVAAPDLDQLVLTPARVELRVGESAGLQLEGFREGRSVGLLTRHRDVQWIARQRDPDHPALELTAATVTGQAAGEGQVQAQLRVGERIVSATADVRVRGAASTSPATADDAPAFQVAPSRVTLLAGEARPVNELLRASLNGRDVTSDCQFDSQAPTVARLDDATESLVGIAPGTTPLTVSHGGRQRQVIVHVRPAAPVDDQAAVELQPREGTFLVGEVVEVRVFIRDARQRRIDRTAAASLQSSDPALLQVQGNRLIPLRPGTVTVRATLPESNASAEAQYTVAAAAAEQLVVSPAQLRLQAGDVARLSPSAIIGSQRRSLVNHPQVSYRVTQGDQRAVALSSDGQLRGIRPGQLVVETQFGELTARTPVEVVPAGRLTLELRPDRQTVAAGQTIRYHAYARQGDSVRRVGEREGVSLRVANESVAEVNGLDVSALSPGVTGVFAQLGTAQATAILRVSDGHAPLRQPAGPVAAALRFDREVVRLRIGDPAFRPRLLDVFANGTTSDVSDAATWELAAEGPLELAGDRLLARRPGVVRVHGIVGSRRTSRPLLVQVNSPSAGSEQLRVSPDAVVLVEGQSRFLQRVQVVNSDGQAFEVPYQLASSDASRVAIVGRRMIGAAPGATAVTVTVTRGDQTLQTQLPVRVQPRPSWAQSPRGSGGSPPGSSGNAENSGRPASRPAGPAPNEVPTVLVLRGPRAALVGEELAYDVQLVRGGQSLPVADQGARLIATPRTRGAGAVPLAGGRLRATGPGVVEIQARLGQWVSNRLAVQVEPAAADYTRLLLEIDRRPLRVAETRSYRIVGVLSDGRRQNLTSVVGQPPSPLSLELGRDREAVQHQPPTLAGAAPGQVALRAVWQRDNGQTLTSNAVLLQVVSAPPSEGLQELRIVPARLTLQVGDVAGPFRVQGRYAGQAGFRDLNLSVTGAGDGVLEPLAAETAARQFRAVGRGTTQVTAQANGLTAAAEVAVVGGWFERVRRIPESQREFGNQFVVDLEVLGRASEPVEFRMLPVANGRPGAPSPWKLAQPEGEGLRVTLTTPRLRFQFAELYHLVIEARGQQSERVERYPYAMSLDVTEAPDRP